MIDFERLFGAIIIALIISFVLSGIVFIVYLGGVYVLVLLGFIALVSIVYKLMKIGDKVIRSRHDELPTNNPYLNG